MRWTSAKSGHAVGRPGCESSLLGRSGAKSFARNESQAQKEQKRTNKTKLRFVGSNRGEPSAASRV
jgi:hypothetical protein